MYVVRAIRRKRPAPPCRNGVPVLRRARLGAELRAYLLEASVGDGRLVQLTREVVGHDEFLRLNQDGDTSRTARKN
jgi:hypothetical protein